MIGTFMWILVAWDKRYDEHVELYCGHHLEVGEVLEMRDVLYRECVRRVSETRSDEFLRSGGWVVIVVPPLLVGVLFVIVFGLSLWIIRGFLPRKNT